MWVKWPGKSKNFYPKIQWFVSAVFGVIEAETKDKDSTKDIPKDRDVPYQRMSLVNMKDNRSWFFLKYYSQTF